MGLGGLGTEANEDSIGISKGLSPKDTLNPKPCIVGLGGVTIRCYSLIRVPYKRGPCLEAVSANMIDTRTFRSKLYIHDLIDHRFGTYLN